MKQTSFLSYPILTLSCHSDLTSFICLRQLFNQSALPCLFHVVVNAVIVVTLYYWNSRYDCTVRQGQGQVIEKEVALWLIRQLSDEPSTLELILYQSPNERLRRGWYHIQVLIIWWHCRWCHPTHRAKYTSKFKTEEKERERKGGGG